MKALVFILLIASPFAFAEAYVGIYTVKRKVVIEPCESERHCGGKPVVEDVGVEQIDIEKFEKGICGDAKHKTMMGKTPFNIELTACSMNDGTVSLYATLRSGPTIKRYGVVKSHESKVNTLVDKPIEVDGKWYRAKLILDPIGPLKQKLPDPYELEQTIVIEACDIKANCEEPPLVSEKFSDKIIMTPMPKEMFCSASVRHDVYFKKYTFESEVNSCVAGGISSLYAMLHSALDSNKYNVVIKLHDKDEWILKGKLVKIDGKYYRARLILNPKTKGVSRKS